MILSGDEFFKLLAANENKSREEVEAEIEELQRREAELDAITTEAGISGNLDEYMSKSDQKNKIATMIFAKKEYLKRLW